MIVRDPATGTDVVTSGILGFGDGLAIFTCSTRAEDDQRVDIYGTTGRISIEIPFNIPPDLPTRIFVTAGGDPPVAPNTETLTFDAADPYTVEADAFADRGPGGTPGPGAAGRRRREPARHRGAHRRGRVGLRLGSGRAERASEGDVLQCGA